KSLNVSRDTAFKAYEHLKTRGIIESIPSKGYYVRESKIRVLLFLDLYSPFKEGLYNSLRNNLPESFSIDLYFHHYNSEVFRNILEYGKGRYQYFVIMSFQGQGTTQVLEKMDKDRVLILDMRYGAPEYFPKIYQDFGDAFYQCLLAGRHKFHKYSEIIYALRSDSHHPDESAIPFINFCSDHGIEGKVIDGVKNEDIKKDKAYIVVSDNDLVRIIEKSKEEKFKMGRDIGLISYNDTAVKKVIGDGITVISTDFSEMGRKAADFLKHPGFIDLSIPTKLIERNSL
ncbi:MAG: substrate-binding domain-containing protein, partial [Bacteroidota bacterium]